MDGEVPVGRNSTFSRPDIIWPTWKKSSLEFDFLLSLAVGLAKYATFFLQSSLSKHLD